MTGTAAPALENPFWDYSLALYGRTGVAEACLALQDRRGLDVNILLFCCWQGHRGAALTVDDLRAVCDATAAWQQGMVVPLRRLRRALKERVWPETENLRQLIKRSELEAERLEQAQLYAIARTGADAPGPTAAAGSLRAYCRVAGIDPGDRDRDDLATLLVAAFSDLSVEQASALLRAP